MRYVIQPLQDNYKALSCRVTELGNYLACPFKHKFSSKLGFDNEALLFGTATHNVLETYMLNYDAALLTLQLLRETNKDRYTKINLYMQACMANELTKKYTTVCSEFKMALEVEVGDVLVVIEGTCDQIVKKPSGKYGIIDFKTSKQERDQEKFDGEIQKILYTIMLAGLVGRDNVEGFDYIVITKHKTPRLHIREYKADKEVCEKFLNDAISRYVTSTIKDQRPAIKNPHCFFCTCKQTCPLYQKTTAF